MQNFLERPFSVIRYEGITDLRLVRRGSPKSSAMGQMELFLYAARFWAVLHVTRQFTQGIKRKTKDALTRL